MQMMTKTVNLLSTARDAEMCEKSLSVLFIFRLYRLCLQSGAEGLQVMGFFSVSAAIGSCKIDKLHMTNYIMFSCGAPVLINVLCRGGFVKGHTHTQKAKAMM